MPKRPRALVAIDGPAGAGKSTVARMVADRMGFVLVDTGAIYRSVALAASRDGLAFDDEPRVGALAETLAAARAIELVSSKKKEEDEERGPDSWSRPNEGSGVRVMLRGEDVSTAIRTPEMSLGASRVSAIPRVRAALLAMQRQAGEQGGVVLEGRDIGTVVFPDAEVKFFLTASVEERSQRRFAELSKKGVETTREATVAEVIQRDKQDTERAIAPLRQADDAIRVDSTGRGIVDVVDEMVRRILEIELSVTEPPSSAPGQVGPAP